MAHHATSIRGSNIVAPVSRVSVCSASPLRRAPSPSARERSGKSFAPINLIWRRGNTRGGARPLLGPLRGAGAGHGRSWGGGCWAPRGARGQGAQTSERPGPTAYMGSCKVSVFCAGVAFTFTLGVSCVHESFRVPTSASAARSFQVRERRSTSRDVHPWCLAPAHGPHRFSANTTDRRLCTHGRYR